MGKRIVRSIVVLVVLASLMGNMAACGKVKERKVRIAQTGVYVSATAQIIVASAIANGTSRSFASVFTR